MEVGLWWRYLLIWAELFLFLMAGNKLGARDVRKWGFLFKLLCNFMDVLFIFTIFWYCKEMYEMWCCKEDILLCKLWVCYQNYIVLCNTKFFSIFRWLPGKDLCSKTQKYTAGRLMCPKTFHCKALVQFEGKSCAASLFEMMLCVHFFSLYLRMSQGVKWWGKMHVEVVL